MFGIENFSLFLAASVLLVLSPGPDTVYILGRSIAQGRMAGLLSAVGVSMGVLVHSFAAGLGLSALLATSATAFLVVKYAGAVYLVYLGVTTFFKRSGPFDADTPDHPTADHWTIVRQGVLSNVLNPKTAVFFLAFLPQFIDPAAGQQVAAFLLLGGVLIGIFACWATVLVLGSSTLTARLRRNRSVGRWLNRVAGGIFVGLGLRLATEKL